MSTVLGEPGLIYGVGHARLLVNKSADDRRAATPLPTRGFRDAAHRIDQITTIYA
jgi:hypothetical protein